MGACLFLMAGKKLGLSELLGMRVILLLIWLIAAPVVAAGGPVTVTLLDVVTTSEGLDVVITGTDQLEHRLIQYVNPSKVIVELPGAVFAKGLNVPQPANPGVKRLRISQERSTAKLIIDLNYQIPQAQIVSGSNPSQLTLRLPFYFTEEHTTRLGAGIYYRQVTKGTSQGPLEINILELNPQVATVTIKTSLATGLTLGKAPLSQIAKENGAFAAINASFFGSDGTPLGLYIEEGRLITEPIYNRTAVAITTDGRILIQPFAFAGKVYLGEELLSVSGLNRQRYGDELIVYTRERGDSTRTNSFGTELVIKDGIVIARYQGDAPIPADGYVLSGHGIFKEKLNQLELGAPCRLELRTQPDWEALNIKYAVGAGPLLVQEGAVKLTTQEEQFQLDIANGRAPRTALGFTEDGRILAVTVNGRRQGVSIGMTLTELAQYLVDLGCDYALNLDGGGSATMVIRDKPLNMPSDGRERHVANAILFLLNTDEESY